MKTIYIPKGETVCYETLETERLIVHGCVRVTYGIHAKAIIGKGVVVAGTIEADDIRVRCIDCASVICKRLIANNVQTPELIASECAAVSTFLSAAYVKTGRLTVAVSEVDEVDADEVVNLGAKRRGLFGLLLASALRSFWTKLTAPAARGADGAPDATAPERKSEKFTPAETKKEPVDEELNRVINLFKLTRESGYTLRIIPGTPEENAPVFNFKTEQIDLPAA